MRTTAAWFCALLMLTSASIAGAEVAMGEPQVLKDGVQLTGWVFDGFAELVEVPEPSGLCYHPGRDTLFIVDDGGLLADGVTVRPAGIYELDLHAAVLHSAEIGDDLEGVCYCSADGMLYAVDEIDERLYVVDPEGLALVAEYQVSRYLDGEEVLTLGGNGFEGIEYIADDGAGGGDYFLLLNQDDPHCLVRIERADIIAAGDEMAVPLTGLWPLAPINLGELHYAAGSGELWVVHSWMNIMEILDIATLSVLRWEVCPGAAQEAVAIDGQGRLWIGYDLGGISRYVWQGTE
jgi:hypothetical protein